jgi:hypothetical protein
MAVLALANRTLTTPSLIEFVSRFEQRVPTEVSSYVRTIYERNQTRNDRLAAQLAETVAAINACGTTPVLLKGAAMLATASRDRWGLKLMSDLDIMVSPDEIKTVMAGLLAIGYRLAFQTRPGAEKWFAELTRPSDVGTVDLHLGAPGPEFFYRPAGYLLAHCERKPVGRGFAYVPSATYQALILMVHDQFQDHDYWIGTIDMRHLLELRDLARSDGGIDWDKLASLTPSKLARNALETQLVTLFSLLDVDVPIGMRNRLIPRLQHRRRMIQARFPPARWFLLPTAFLDYRNYRDGPGTERMMHPGTSDRLLRLPRAGTLSFLFSLSSDRRVGKI